MTLRLILDGGAMWVWAALSGFQRNVGPPPFGRNKEFSRFEKTAVTGSGAHSAV
jgi:hypothetical protein